MGLRLVVAVTDGDWFFAGAQAAHIRPFAEGGEPLLPPGEEPVPGLDPGMARSAG